MRGCGGGGWVLYLDLLIKLIVYKINNMKISQKIKIFWREAGRKKITDLKTKFIYAGIS